MKNTIREQRLTVALWAADLEGLRALGWPAADEYAPEARDLARVRGGTALVNQLAEVWEYWFGVGHSRRNFVAAARVVMRHHAALTFRGRLPVFPRCRRHSAQDRRRKSA